MRSQFLPFVLLAVVLTHGEAEQSQIYLKYNYVSAPKYSLDGINFKRTRNEFSFRSFYPEFKEIYQSKFGDAPLRKAESYHLWANILGIPGGALLGFGTAQFIVRRDGNGKKVGAIFCLASAPLLIASISFGSSGIRVDEPVFAGLF